MVEAQKEEIRVEPKITVDFNPGRWGKTFRLVDVYGKEITLNHKDAVKLARNILKIVRESEE